MWCDILRCAADTDAGDAAAAAAGGGGADDATVADEAGVTENIINSAAVRLM